jgi:hypothetical protein
MVDLEQQKRSDSSSPIATLYFFIATSTPLDQPGDPQVLVNIVNEGKVLNTSNQIKEDLLSSNVNIESTES